MAIRTGTRPAPPSPTRGCATAGIAAPTIDRIKDWLKAQSWLLVRRSEQFVRSRAYWHQCGFIVVRLRETPFSGWGLRVHLWSPAFLERGDRLADVHSHGWALVSRTLLGSVTDERYAVDFGASSAKSPLAEYVVDSDYVAGRSLLVRRRNGVRATLLESNEFAANGQPHHIPSDGYHRTVPSPDAPRWSVTLVATEERRATTRSSVLLDAGYPKAVYQARPPVPDLAAILAEIDAQSPWSGDRDR